MLLWHSSKDNGFDAVEGTLINPCGNGEKTIYRNHQQCTAGFTEVSDSFPVTLTNDSFPLRGGGGGGSDAHGESGKLSLSSVDPAVPIHRIAT